MDIYYFIITISVLVCCTVDVFCQNSNLDQYCFNKIQRGKRPVLTKMGFWNFILICSNIEQYSNCLVDTRRSKPSQVKIQTYEVDFPPEYDVKRAGFLFCSFHFLQRPEDYMPDEKQLSSCERSISYSQCLTKATTKYSNNMKFRDTTFNSSCRAMLEYSNCLKEAYVKCNSTYEYLFDYYYARIGSDCLISQNVFNSIVVVEKCNGNELRRANSDVSVFEQNSWLYLLPMLTYWLNQCQ
ncbi:uncharacterized protein LOC106053551 isoform X1 [Biomphalaria glabrata]|uniref:Uncharacterized protein LOC106053551 isoform X1 n=1 Tax=Biomphalaria glabrata TaxID=6526 RepID=A0A9W2YED5_BIOGL|nr:uncharacterized protein LOC106053551 isoform X1 [Biomphalaria glabrata]KAI8782745.1 hypothetical protein BgiBS90_016232 [Biomphalaria glabrata]